VFNDIVGDIRVHVKLLSYSNKKRSFFMLDYLAVCSESLAIVMSLRSSRQDCFCVAHVLAHWWGSGELDRGDPFGQRHFD
jgi:hypothetical protein